MRVYIGRNTYAILFVHPLGKVGGSRGTAGSVGPQDGVTWLLKTTHGR
jgi:hypothetical protein